MGLVLKHLSYRHREMTLNLSRTLILGIWSKAVSFMNRIRAQPHSVSIGPRSLKQFKGSLEQFHRKPL